MINLTPIIERVRRLLDEGTDASITYAALEARLALEKVCYDRLRQRHDYISHDQLSKWQPGAAVNTLMAEVDPHVAETMTLSIGKNPGVPVEEDDYVELGTEVGFDPKHFSKMWNALGKLALHVRLPTNRQDEISDYGDPSSIRLKVEEVVAELVSLAKGNITLSGIGEEVSFHCSCGEKNRRKAALLRDQQRVHCINPNCKMVWRAIRESDGFAFEELTVDVKCERCRVENFMPWRGIHEMTREQVGAFPCRDCGHRNHIQWRLMQVRPSETAEAAAGLAQGDA